jgi:hypothetical protein
MQTVPAVLQDTLGDLLVLSRESFIHVQRLS